MRTSKIIVLSLAIVLFFSIGVKDMLGVGKTCVFSSVKMQILKNGKPVKNAQVIRRWEWNKLKEEKTTTDENGYFSLPAVYESSVSRLLPIELVIAQGIYVVEEGEEKKIWSNSKRKPDENVEFGGKPIDMRCELTNDLKIYKQFGSRMRTLCEWED